jgi:hypothetical protein
MNLGVGDVNLQGSKEANDASTWHVKAHQSSYLAEGIVREMLQQDDQRILKQNSTFYMTCRAFVRLHLFHASGD